MLRHNGLIEHAGMKALYPLKQISNIFTLVLTSREKHFENGIGSNFIDTDALNFT